LRSLIIRFIDCEGPGILDDILREKGFNVTYHDAYRKGLQLVPESHQIFKLIILMGGPQSVANPEEKAFFKPYFQLVEDALSLSSNKVLGICLGAQIVAQALGGQVRKGENGQEIGFGTVQVKNPNHPVFAGITGAELPIFHFHGDTYENPSGSENLLSSDKYPAQMFSYQNKAFGVQGHFELTAPMLQVWKNRFPEVGKAVPNINESIHSQITSIHENGRKIFENIINL
jgi:GMP synthase-like glutamine amidotransferase